jgi:hypothetical protein
MTQQATIAEAARQLGVSRDTVRRHIRRGRLPASKRPTSNGLAWLVDLSDDARAPTGQAAREGGLSREEVGHWRELAMTLSRELAARTHEVQQLLALLERAHGRLFGPPVPEAGRARETNGHPANGALSRR